MAKKQLGFGVKKKKPSQPLSEEAINQIVDKIEVPVSSEPPRKVVQAEVEEELTVKTSIDIPETLFDDMKMALIKKRNAKGRKMTMRDYLLKLIREDLYKK